MPRPPLALALLAGFVSTAVGADHPTHTLKTDQLAVTVYLPDAEKGFYRGTRFDWSGVFSVEFGKHKLFGPWRAADPTDHDSVVGPCEEFGTAAALGYDDAKPGETFVKIGVGELEKPQEGKYSQFAKYKIAKPGEWKVDTAGGRVSFEQTVKAASGYGYKYTKIVAASGAELRIMHVLENTGARPIKTDHYNHNFFNVDGDPVGKGYELEFPFAPKADAPKERFAELVKLDGKKLTLTGPLDKGTIYAELGGYGTADGSKDAAVTMRHAPTGVTVRASGDRAPSKFNVWGMKTTLCPEPFLQFAIEPGKKATWTWKYVFSK